MADPFKEGDRVQVVDRAATAADIKSNMFYNHYRNLVGTVQKVYESSGDVSVTVDEASLPEAIAIRHNDVRQGMKTKWLEGLSEEARNRLTDQEKDFTLRYTILVAPKDLIPSSQPTPDGTRASVAEKSIETAATEPPRRKTAAEIEAAEEEYLRSRKAEG